MSERSYCRKFNEGNRCVNLGINLAECDRCIHSISAVILSDNYEEEEVDEE